MTREEIYKATQFCAECGRPAIYTMQFKGFCALHKVQAQAAARRLMGFQDSRRWRRQRRIPCQATA